MPSPERRYFNDSTAQLAQRIRDARAKYNAALGDIYYELVFRERKAARELRAKLAGPFEPSVDGFPWPGTEVVAGTGRRKLPPDSFPIGHGLLARMGYSVGKNGVAEPERHDLLVDIYNGPLPSVWLPPAYQRQWGQPSTATRLKKLANCLAAFARTRKRDDPATYSAAIADWESDLAFLKRRVYDGRYNFPWPPSDVARR